VEAANRVGLNGYQPAWASSANDQGSVNADLPMQHLIIVLRRSPEQQVAFERLLAEQQDPSSPNFHHWLTPVEVGERFGVSAHDIESVGTWLTGQGLSFDSISNSRTRIAFSGNASAVASAFSTELHAYSVDAEIRIAIASEPQIPLALSGVIRAVSGLYTVKDRAYHGAGTGFMPVGAGAIDQPGGSFCNGSSCNHYVFPADFAKIYGLNPVYRQGADGSGQTIAIVGRARVYNQDIENFESLSGLALKDPNVIVPPSGVDPGAAASSGGASGAQLEATIDVTRATSVAPGAQIDLVVSGNTMTLNGIAVAAEYVIDTNPVPAHIMNMSFGACEANAGASGVTFYDDMFSQAAAEGISVFVCSGDAGAAGCDGYNATPPANQIASPNYICSSTHATCVGGTEFADTANPSAYWSSSNGVGYESALQYIPEGAWNQPTYVSGGQTEYQASASGGGVSAYIATPTWQTGTGVPGTQGRYTPDVAFSSSAHDGYFACLAANGNPCTVVSGHFTFAYVYGTSAAAPDMAGLTALLNQEMSGFQGELNARLYALAETTSKGVFHDVTIASSGVSGCSAVTPSMCNNSTPSPAALTGGLQGYLVRAGYDEVTGLGSIDATNLMAHWSTVTDLIFRNGFQ
jgi:pseudomonalisin